MGIEGRRKIELLAPAANIEIAGQAVLHGADAVYIGAESHGARKRAANSVDDLAELVKFAHQFRARVYVTVNTLVYEHEIAQVENLIRRLYEIGVDALIVQDMGILRMNVPPIELHASTQCDTRTVEKARFLQDVGFSQIVLARELSVKTISEICKSVNVPVECFVHGALCVSYSGRCLASEATLGRSANRGECAQMCRMRYTLSDASGRELIKDKYLLSLRDLNASESVESLLEAGVSSFKIEGRLKDENYVKNITAHYRRLIDDVISRNPEKYVRSSYGLSEISFEPNPSKSFNRGFTSYFLNTSSGAKTSPDTPKSQGEIIGSVSELHNGDGIGFYNSKGEYEGVRINRMEGSKIVGARPIHLPHGAEIHRTYDVQWEKMLSRPTAVRHIGLDIEIDETGISACDERGVAVRIPLDVVKEKARKRMLPENVFAKLGNTIYRLDSFENRLNPDTFIPASELTRLRRQLIEALDKANEATYPLKLRRNENSDTPYPRGFAGVSENVANSLAAKFYEDHAAELRDWAYEVKPRNNEPVEVMKTKFCLRRELGICKKLARNADTRFRNIREPLYLTTGPHRFRLHFDCASCEMSLFKD